MAIQLLDIMQPRKLPTIKGYQILQRDGIPCNLGFGSYGSVLMGKSLTTGQKVAVKKIGRKMAFHQVEVHMKLNHPNIIRMLDYYYDEKHQCTYIVLQYAQNGTLFDYIHDKGIKDKRMAKGIFHSVCDAIDYLHSNNIMHRDIKPQNILLDRKNVVKLCDFGFAANCEPRMTMCGTVEYMSPQMILRKTYDHKVDIWGIGILFYEMIQGRAPFEGQTQQEVLQKMKKPITFSKNFTLDQIQLVQKILRINPSQRPQIKQIIKSPCLKITQLGEQSSKRSTAEEQVKSIKEIKQVKPVQKKIKIVEIKQIDSAQKNQKYQKVEKSQKVQKVQKSEKKNNFGIQITSIRDLNQSQIPQIKTVAPMNMKVQKIEKSILGINPNGKQKISLKKVTKKV